MAVLKASASMSAVTFLIVAWTTLFCAAGGRDVLDGLAQLPAAFLVFLHDETPHPRQEPRHALHAGHAPGFGLFERSHEHLVETQRIRAVFGDDLVGVDHVAAALGHLLAVLAEDEALIDQPLERLGRGDVAVIEEHLVPEPRVEQVQHGVFGAADVEIDAAGLAAVHPVTLGRFADETLRVARVAITQVIPARPRPLRHGVGLARGGVGIAHPVGGLGEGGSPVPVGLKSSRSGGRRGNSLSGKDGVFAVVSR